MTSGTAYSTTTVSLIEVLPGKTPDNPWPYGYLLIDIRINIIVDRRLPGSKEEYQSNQVRNRKVRNPSINGPYNICVQIVPKSPAMLATIARMKTQCVQCNTELIVSRIDVLAILDKAWFSNLLKYI